MCGALEARLDYGKDDEGARMTAAELLLLFLLLLLRQFRPDARLREHARRQGVAVMAP